MPELLEMLVLGDFRFSKLRSFSDSELRVGNVQFRGGNTEVCKGRLHSSRATSFKFLHNCNSECKTIAVKRRISIIDGSKKLTLLVRTYFIGLGQF